MKNPNFLVILTDQKIRVSTLGARDVAFSHLCLKQWNSQSFIDTSCFHFNLPTNGRTCPPVGHLLWPPYGPLVSLSANVLLAHPPYRSAAQPFKSDRRQLEGAFRG